LLSLLVNAGFEHFVVPDGSGQRCLQILSNLPSGPRLGFVTEISDLLGRNWALANLPTAIALPGNSMTNARLVDRLKQLRHVSQVLIYVAEQSAQLCGKPVAQVVSNCAPLRVENLVAASRIQ